ncbi:magnesium and cobalt transport protein CorA [Streptomyces marianii]|uniref:Magnesium and cobalt transport protein CorA n=1 Tax=Streptomyces marianii TaxID=1817406 RepID=A0A5R9EE14_9ACTN|nr:magnesium and cobalt transport protein CorA [Streptomyces marianii]TLQ48248.1 magnesium and cobalt transport protein CorA [Streptomyces marianii]
MIHTLGRAVRRVYRRRVDLSHPARSPLGSSVVDCVGYADGVRQAGSCPAAEALRRVREENGADPAGSFVWIGLHEPSREEFEELAELFELHPLTVEDAVDAHSRAKVVPYDGTVLAVFRTVGHAAHAEVASTTQVVETGEITVITGRDFVVTVRYGRHGSLGPVREALEAAPEQLAKGPSSVLHAVADFVVDEYLAVAEAVQQDIDAVESAVFSGHAGRGAAGRSEAGRIYQLKRGLLEFKRAMSPLHRPLEALAHQPASLIAPEIRPYFRDVSDHLARAGEQIHGYDALLDSILQAHLAQMTVAQNEDMRKITAWAAIVAVPTMVCGAYGMNFEHMPLTGSVWGYPLVLAVIAVACHVIHRGFRRNGWL